MTQQLLGEVEQRRLLIHLSPLQEVKELRPLQGNAHLVAHVGQEAEGLGTKVGPVGRSHIEDAQGTVSRTEGHRRVDGQPAAITQGSMQPAAMDLVVGLGQAPAGAQLAAGTTARPGSASRRQRRRQIVLCRQHPVAGCGVTGVGHVLQRDPGALQAHQLDQIGECLLEDTTHVDGLVQALDDAVQRDQVVYWLYLGGHQWLHSQPV